MSPLTDSEAARRRDALGARWASRLASAQFLPFCVRDANGRGRFPKPHVQDHGKPASIRLPEPRRDPVIPRCGSVVPVPLAPGSVLADSDGLPSRLVCASRPQPEPDQ
jgi:hypothetical protein